MFKEIIVCVCVFVCFPNPELEGWVGRSVLCRSKVILGIQTLGGVCRRELYAATAAATTAFYKAGKKIYSRVRCRRRNDRQSRREGEKEGEKVCQ